MVSSRWLRFVKEKEAHAVRLVSATSEGTLQVTDAEKFRQLLTEGIGRERAYGLGLMTIVSAERDRGRASEPDVWKRCGGGRSAS